MNLQPKELKNEAALRLATTPGNHNKLALIYGAVALGVGVFCQLIAFLTNLAISNMSGLSTLGTRAILQSIQSFFPVAANLLLPFWAFGLMQTVLRLIRQERVEPRDLLGGFSRLFVIVRLYLFIILFFWCIAFLAFNLATIILNFTPFANTMLASWLPYVQDAALLEEALSDPAQTAALMKSAYPLLILGGILLLAFGLPAVYGMRLSFYRVLDQDRPGALRAITQSRRMMRGNKIALFKLDLSFWWYYLAIILSSLLLYVPSYLPAPFNSDLAFLVAALIQAGICLWLYTKYLIRIEASYAVFYDTLYEAHNAPPAPPVFWQQPQQ